MRNPQSENTVRKQNLIHLSRNLSRQAAVVDRQVSCKGICPIIHRRFDKHLVPDQLYEQPMYVEVVVYLQLRSLSLCIGRDNQGCLPSTVDVILLADTKSVFFWSFENF